MPPNIPNPPEASELPPNAAKVDVVAAAPERLEIATPVDAVPKTPTKVNVPAAPAAPSVIPAIKLVPDELSVKTEIFAANKSA